MQGVHGWNVTSPDPIGSLEIPVPEHERRREWRVLLAEAVIAVLLLSGAVAFLPLYEKIPAAREQAVTFALTRVLPLFVLHAVLFALVVSWRKTATAAFLLWGGSFALLLALGGPLRAAAIAGAAGVAVLGMLAGRTCCRYVFDPADRKWPISLVAGCGVLSTAVTYLAWFELLYAGTLLGVVGLIVVLPFVRPRGRAATIEEGGESTVDAVTVSKKERRKWREERRSRREVASAAATEEADAPRQNQRTFTNGQLVLLELAFLLLSLLVVSASAPELSSDAVRMYVPQLKLIDLFNGFYSLPQTWSFVIPQAGITYAEAFHVVFGPAAARYAMLVALVALGALIATFERFSEWSLSLALIVCFTPFVARLGSSLMLDVFVALTVLLVGAIAVRGRLDRLWLYFGSIGAAIGLAWCAKYSTITYAAPLGLFALWRAARATSLKRAVAAAFVAVPVGAAVTAGPWLLRTWRESGNPVFPFFLNIFPAPLWPEGVLDISGLMPLPEWWRVMLAPVEFTYRTSRYIEGFDGALGLTLLALFVGALLAIWKGDASARALIAAAVVGTAAIWITSAYIRYWMPTLFLLALGVSIFVARQQTMRRRVVGAVVAASISIVIALPIFAASSWFDPNGIAWDFYIGETSFDDYIARRPGFEAMHELKRIDPDFPRVLQTSVETAGHWPVIPIEALIWEFWIHGVRDARSAEAWIEGYKADYWVVNLSDGQGRYLANLVGARYFRDDLRIASAGSVEVFAMPNSARARAALKIVNERPAPEELSLNGSFEDSAPDGRVDGWTFSEGAEVRKDGQAKDGAAYVRVTRSAAATQLIDVSGTRAITISEWIRANSPTAREVRLQVNWLDDDGTFLSASIDVVSATAEWKKYSTMARVPKGATDAIVYLANHDPAAVTDFDNVSVVPADR